MQSFLMQNNTWLLIIMLLWVLPWKAYALWTSARMNHKKWFIALMLINTFAILEIIYVFFVVKKTPKDLLKVFQSKL